MATTTTHAVSLGQELPQLVKEIPQRKIDAYSGVRPNSIHSDEAWARKKGFPAPLAQAMMSTAYVSELMTRFVGAGFVKGGTMSMAFIKPVLAGDRLTVHGVVKEKHPDGDRTRVVVGSSAEDTSVQTTTRPSPEGDDVRLQLDVTPEPDGTYKQYFLQVPPTVRSARQAVAWTYGLTEHEYTALKHRT